MKEKIRTILESLKEKKIAVSAVEKELGFSNGLLAKAKETGSLSDEKFEKLQKFADLKLNGVHQDVAVVPTQKTEQPKMVVEKTGNLSLRPSPEAMKRGQEAIESINKDFGEGTIMRLGDKPNLKIEAISTGSISLNKALGIGGFPKGRIIEIYGAAGSGKTTIALSAISEAQKLGGQCAFIDAEHAFDPEYAANLGVDIDNLHFSQPDCGEHALEEADRLTISGSYAVIVIDSVAALTPKAELEGEMGDSKMGLMARLMSQACRKIVSIVSKTNTVLIFINQLREKIGVIYGSPYVVPGGNALKFYSSVRLDVSRATNIMAGDEQIGSKTRVKVVKNKCAPPFKTAEFDIIFGEGIDAVGEIIDLSVEQSVVKKSGSWYSYKDDKLGQGREAVRQLLKDNPALLQEIADKIKV